MTQKEYSALKDKIEEAIHGLILYVATEDFIQECFLHLLEVSKDLPEDLQIQRAISKSVTSTEPSRPEWANRKRMYEIPIGTPEHFIEHPRQFTREY